MKVRTLIILIASLAGAAFLFLIVAGLGLALLLSSGSEGGDPGGWSWQQQQQQWPVERQFNGGGYMPYAPMPGGGEQIWQTRGGASGSYDPGSGEGVIHLPNGGLVGFGG